VAAVILVLRLAVGDYQEQRFVGDESLRSPEFPGLKLTAEQVLKAGV
jgi:Uma2 family endonuclease